MRKQIWMAQGKAPLFPRKSQMLIPDSGLQTLPGFSFQNHHTENLLSLSSTIASVYSATVLLASALLLLDIPQASERSLVPEGWWEQSCLAYMVFSRLSKRYDTFALAEG